MEQVSGEFTCLRRQKRRGRKQEKRYLLHRITQEKHQLSRVMLTPEVSVPPPRARGSGCGGEEDRLLWGGGEDQGESPAPQEQPGCPGPSSGRSSMGPPRHGPDVAPSARKP